MVLTSKFFILCYFMYVLVGNFVLVEFTKAVPLEQLVSRDPLYASYILVKFGI